MQHWGAVVQRDGSVVLCSPFGKVATWRGVHDATEVVRKTLGSEYATVWVADAWPVLRRLIAESPDNTRGYKPVLTRDSVGGVTAGRVRWRSIEQWVAWDPTVYQVPSVHARALVDAARELESMCGELGVKMRGTAASAAHVLWREEYNPVRRWSCRGIGTETLDAWHDAYFGGMVRQYGTRWYGFGPGAHHVYLAMDQRGDSIGDPKPLASNERVVRIDLSSAYPYMMSREMPWVWRHEETTDVARVLGGLGIADCDVRIGRRAVLPLRFRDAHGERKVVWPPAGEWPGTWSTIHLRELVATGGEVLKVRRAWLFPRSYVPYERFARALYDAAYSNDAPLRRSALKRMCTRLYGVLGMYRVVRNCVPRDSVQAETVHAVHLPQLGPWCLIPDVRERYAPQCNPPHAGLITALCHVKVDRALRQIEERGGRVVRVDTDSITFVAPVGDVREGTWVDAVAWAGLGDGQRALGAWRETHRWKWAMQCGHVLLAENGYVQASGIPTSAHAELWRTGRARGWRAVGWGGRPDDNPRFIGHRECEWRLTPNGVVEENVGQAATT